LAAEAEFEIQGPYFAPPHRDEFFRIITERYNAARAEAARVAGIKGIDMKVEYFKPVHFGWSATGYKLPTGDTTKTLKANMGWFPAGLINWDSSFDYIKWYEGNKTSYIGDWFVFPVYYFQEKQGAYKGNLKHYEFRGDETFTITIHSTTTPTPSTVDAWLIAFIVLPKTEAETRITTA